MLGVDACKTGWVGIALSQEALGAYAAAEISDLVEHADSDGPLSVIAIDIPIGLPDTGRRQADLLVRNAVGPRWASVFITPVRPALETDDYPSAVALSLHLTDKGISRQAFGLRAKSRQVDRWIRPTRHRVMEIHPELSFAHLAGQPLANPKSTWARIAQRKQLLTGAGIALPEDLGPAGERADAGDVLDAAAAAWAAMRVIQGQARPYPDPPELFSDGLASAIWA